VLLRIFDFQNGGRPPSWIWCDIMAEHPRFVFDGPNILLKLRVDRNSYSDVAGWLAGWLSHSGIVSKPINLSENFFDHLKAPSF